jgi:hypothetical protein
MNLLHQYESKTKENLDIIEFRHNIDTKKIFGEGSLKISPVPLMREIFGIYRRPLIARGTRSLFSDVKFIGDIPNKEFVSLLKPNTYYTYAIDDEKITFAVTRPGKMRDFGSKHAILRDQSHELHLAGEFYVDEKGVFHFDGASGTFQPPNTVTQKGLTFFRDEMGIENSQVHLFEPPPAPVKAPASQPKYRIPNYPGVRAVAFVNAHSYRNLEGKTIELKDEKGNLKPFKLELAESSVTKELIYDTKDFKLLKTNSELRATRELAGTSSAESLARIKTGGDKLVQVAREERTTKVFTTPERKFFIQVDEVKMVGMDGKVKNKNATHYEYRVTGTDQSIAEIKKKLELSDPSGPENQIVLKQLGL